VRGAIDELAVEDWDRVLAINLRAPFSAPARRCGS